MNWTRRLRRKPIYILPSASASMVSRYADGYKAGREAGYAAALRDAVEAVKSAEWSGATWSANDQAAASTVAVAERTAAVAAIEALAVYESNGNLSHGINTENFLNGDKK